MTAPVHKSSNPLANRDRIKLPRQHMPEQPAETRSKQFSEVNTGYSTELARQEALRCLECQAHLYGTLSGGSEGARVRAAYRGW
jgi:hypothetical protein